MSDHVKKSRPCHYHDHDLCKAPNCDCTCHPRNQYLHTKASAMPIRQPKEKEVWTTTGEPATILYFDPISEGVLVRFGQKPTPRWYADHHWKNYWSPPKEPIPLKTNTLLVTVRRGKLVGFEEHTITGLRRVITAVNGSRRGPSPSPLQCFQLPIMTDSATWLTEDELRDRYAAVRDGVDDDDDDE